MKPAHLMLAALLALASGPATTAEAPANLQRQLARMRTGDTLDITGLGPVNSLPLHRVSREWQGGTLVFSDSPEYVAGPGILYADTLAPGIARLFVYHVNATSQAGSPRALKFSVVIEPASVGSAPTVRIRRKSVQGPSLNYTSVGVSAAKDLLGPENPSAPFTVTKRRILDNDLERRVNASVYGYLVCGQYDLEIVGAPLKISIVAVEHGQDAAQALPSLAPHPRDGHDRGTFPMQAAKSVDSAATYATSQGLARFRMAGGVSFSQDPDPFAGEGGWPGYDALSGGAPARLLGNYGVTYTVNLNLHAPDGRRVAILLNPRGGDFAGAVANADALTGAGIFATPSSGVLPHTVRATLLGRWDPAAHPVATLTWTPPGASALPVDWILVPYPEPGDANGNGVVDLLDATMAIRFATAVATPNPRAKIAADMDGDQTVSMADAVAILRLAAGLAAPS